MFTGIVEGIGRVAAAVGRAESLRLTVATPRAIAGLRVGDSVAVDGVCLTAAAVSPRRFSADVIPESLSRTTLSRLRAGDRVNLESSLKVGSPLGGHWVLGHVDAVVEVRKVVQDASGYRLRLALPSELRRFVAFKGSVALHGVSLTVSGVSEDEFEVALIPETRQRTTLGAARPGSKVNVEVDVLARYLEARLASSPAETSVRGRSTSKRSRR